MNQPRTISEMWVGLLERNLDGMDESTPTAIPGLADEVIHSFLATNADDVDLIHEDLDQIDDLDLEEMDINWQIAMTAIKIKKFYKKTGRRPRVDGKMHVAFDKRKVECFNCHNTGHFARECKFKGSKEGGRQEAGRGQDFKPVRTEKEALMTIDEGQINWVEQTTDEELNHALMAFTVNNEVSMCSKLCLDSYNALQAKYDELQSEFGLGYGIKSNAEVLGYEEEISRGIFAFRETNAGYNDIPLYSRFKQVEYKGVPHPLSGDYTPREQEDIDDSLYEYGIQGEDFAKKMVDLVNQRKKYFAEERARAKRNKPMTQSQLKTYMMNYLKNQGTWKLSQLKNLSFEEVKKEFDKLVKQVESFAPINFEATKASLKRFGEELQTKTPKRLKDDEDVEAKDDEPTKKSGKRRKQMARKGLHTSVDKDDSEGSDEDSEQDDSVTGTKTPINPVPVAMKTPSIATYKIFKQGEKGAYQIVREDGTDVVYINFGAMLKVISRDDLTELYRIVMNRYGMNGPEDELERVFWKYLKNMFEEPLSTDPIWSELGQQRIISWRYYESCRVHCLNLESMDIYMLIERTYPLSAEMCKAMLDKKLQGGKPDENCYKMLKMMEKQAGIRK
ncbi:ribonuclease H-like domain-containing protein [Tanacetum coccineum]